MDPIQRNELISEVLRERGIEDPHLARYLSSYIDDAQRVIETREDIERLVDLRGDTLSRDYVVNRYVQDIFGIAFSHATENSVMPSPQIARLMAEALYERDIHEGDEYQRRHIQRLLTADPPVETRAEIDRILDVPMVRRGRPPAVQAELDTIVERANVILERRRGENPTVRNLGPIFQQMRLNRAIDVYHTLRTRLRMSRDELNKLYLDYPEETFEDDDPRTKMRMIITELIGSLTQYKRQLDA